jgi:alkane 1-monooxygenase
MPAPMIPASNLRSPSHALPFWLSLAIVPLVFVAAALGGWWFLLIPAQHGGCGGAGHLIGLYSENADPQTPDRT